MRLGGFLRPLLVTGPSFEQGVGYGGFTLRVPCSKRLLPHVTSVLASHSSSHSIEGRSNRGKGYRVGLHWEGFSKYRSDILGHNIMMRHRESHSSMPITTTEIEYNSCHEVDVEVPIRLGCSLSIGARVSTLESWV